MEDELIKISKEKYKKRKMGRMRTLSKKEIKKWLLENCVDEDGDLNLTDLDFSDFDGDIYTSGMKVKQTLYQNFQKVGVDLIQNFQKVNRDLYQSCQKVDGDLWQHSQIVGGEFLNYKLLNHEEWERHTGYVKRVKKENKK